MEGPNVVRSHLREAAEPAADISLPGEGKQRVQSTCIPSQCCAVGKSEGVSELEWMVVFGSPCMSRRPVGVLDRVEGHYLRCHIHPRVDAHTFTFGLQGHGLGKVEAVTAVSRKTETPVQERRGRLERGQR